MVQYRFEGATDIQQKQYHKPAFGSEKTQQYVTSINLLVEEGT